jgi:hypothetical protein
MHFIAPHLSRGWKEALFCIVVMVMIVLAPVVFMAIGREIEED